VRPKGEGPEGPSQPTEFDKIAERFWTTRTRRSGAKRRTSGRPRPRAISPSPPN